MSDKLAQVISAINRGERPTKVDLSNAKLDAFPNELLVLKDSLEFLNMGGNNLSSLPEELGDFTRLRILFFAQNRFESIPIQLGRIPSLFMVSFKSNRVKYIPPESLSPSVSWLILTDNLIEELPSSIGNLHTLQKLMLAGNKLKALPEELKKCEQLELLRIAANNLTYLPEWLLRMPRLAWLAFAGNPLFEQPCIMPPTPPSSSSNPAIPSSAADAAAANTNNDIPWAELQLLEQLGEGASGYVHKALWMPSGSVCTAGGSIRNSDNSIGTESGTGFNMGQMAGTTIGAGKQNEVLEVAVKLFKGETTSDGLPTNEMEATEAVGEHPNFIPVLGRIRGAPGGQQGLVLPLIDTQSSFCVLGQPPSFDTITRDTFPAEKRFTPAFVLKVLLGIASACLHLHSTGTGITCTSSVPTVGTCAGQLTNLKDTTTTTTTSTSTSTSTARSSTSILHGDLYAHNILTNDNGDALLTDFGAASFKSTPSFRLSETQCRQLEGIEVRAFGCLVEDLSSRLLVPVPVADRVEAVATSTAEVPRQQGENLRDPGDVSDDSGDFYMIRQHLEQLRADCCQPDVMKRPTFLTLHTRLASLQNTFVCRT